MHSRLLFAAFLLLAAPTASAAFQPAYYFLRDGETGPVGDGLLAIEPPAPLDTANPANNTPPSTRIIFPAPLPPAQFAMANASDNTGWIYGPIVVLLYAPNSPAMQHGNVTVSLVVYDPDAVPGLDEPTVLATGSVANDAANLTTPDPTTVIPPDPTDPEAALAYIEGQLLAYGLPLLLQFPLVYFLDDNVTDGYVNAQIDPDSRLALRITLDPGSSEAPVAQGAQAIEYDFALAPSLVYIPWYAPNPAPVASPPATPPPTASPTAPPVTPPPGEDEDDGGSKDKGSPGLGLLAAVAAVGLAAAMRRRRA